MTSNEIQKTDHSDTPLITEMESLGLTEESIATCSTTVIVTGTDTKSDSSPRKMNLRKRAPYIRTENRRVITKPIKRLNEIKQIYLCKKVNKLTPNLETIYEEPKITNSNELQLIGLKKEKRFIVFEQNKKGKIKKRQVKIKKIFNKKILKKKHLTMDLLLKKLSSIE